MNHSNESLPESLDDTTTTLAVDPPRVLETLVTELENLVLAADPAVVSGLTALYGALLAHNLGGREELLPVVTFGLSARQRRERRVVRIARRIMRDGAGDPMVALEIASVAIEQRLHFISAELGTLAA